MNSASAQLSFGAETVAALAAATGLALVVLLGRIDSRRRSPIAALLGTGFLLLVLAGVLAGASILDSDHPTVIALRLAGAVAVAVAGSIWDQDRGVQVPLLGGAAAVAASVPVSVTATTPASVVLGIGGVLLLIGAGAAARRSIATRVAVGLGATLLTLVVALAVALSAILDNNLRDEAVRRVEVRASAESGAVERSLADAVQVSFLISSNLELSFGLPRLHDIAAGGKRDAALDTALANRARIFRDQAFLYVGADAPVIVGQTSSVTPTLEPREATAIAGSDAVAATTCDDALGTIGIVTLPGRAFGIAVLALCSDGRPQVRAGRLISVVPFGDDYLAGQQAEEESIGLSVIGPGGVVSTVGPSADPVAVRELASEVLKDGKTRTSVVSDSFVAIAAPADIADGPPPVVIAVSTPTATIARTRSNLDRVLFGIALAGGLLALALAAAFGERIGSRLRQLTLAAEAVRRGDPGVRTNVIGGDEVGTLGATFDAMASAIEEKTDAEARLRERLEAVVGGMGEALVAVDADGRITDFNSAAEDLVSCSAATARGREAVDVLVLSTEDGADLTPRLKRPLRSRWTANAVLTPLEGADVPIAISGGPLFGPEGDPAGGVFVLRDLRFEREVERMKSEFLSRVSHELRTPLTGVLGYAELLQRRSFPPERTAEMLGEISTSGNRLKRIVELLEFFAADAAGRRVLRPEPVELKPIVEGVVADAGETLPPGVAISKRVARSLPRVDVDERWLRNALAELVDNAVKFSPGGGRVQISAGMTDDGQVEIAVVDRGIGMAPGDVERAFTDFEQADTSDTRRYGGLGLGLPLVRRVAEGHGGEVRCQSSPGRGTRVALVLPPIVGRRRARRSADA